jgi:hypothetical protein
MYVEPVIGLFGVKVNDDDPGGITIPTWYGDDTISETDNGSNTPSKFLGEFSSYIDDVVMVSNTRYEDALGLKNSKVVSPEILEPVWGKSKYEGIFY